jgi:Spy/CpxP family protein refolding chaperone
MKTRSAIALAAAAALLSGLTAASAADVASSHSGMAMTASDSLNLTAAQQKTAWNDLNKQASAQTAPSDFSAIAGSKVPDTVTIKAIPTRTARAVSQLRPYDFAMVSGKILIVNPKDRTVAEVLSG